jgi:DNA invertase Pin-like site-specific DNA recombinase
VNPLPALDPRRSVAYRRVSTVDQADSGYGLDAQRDAISAFIRREGLELVGSFDDPGVSGILPLEERPGLSQALIFAMTKGAGALVVARHDRLARDTLIALLIERSFADAGIRILYADSSNGESDADRFTRTVLHAAAEQAKRDVVRRLAAGRQVKAAMKPGSYLGGRSPYGYRPQGHELTIAPAEADLVRRIFTLARDGTSVRAIASTLDEEDPSRRWHRTAVERILKRDLYMREKPGRIVDARLWHAAQRALAERHRLRAAQATEACRGERMNIHMNRTRSAGWGGSLEVAPSLESAARRPPQLSDGIRGRIVSERATGRTLSAFAEALNEDQVPTAQGGAQWWPSTVRAVLQSRRLNS